MRYKITLAYSGAAFCGWQIQPGDPSVQGAVQDALSTLLGCPVEVVGAGRTDTAVNASYYVAHFDYGTSGDETGVEDLDTAQLCYRLNAILPREIAVFSIERTDADFHARFGAKSREYRYYIHNRKDPFRNDFSWYCRFDLDMERMNRACGYLLGTHDCRCFEKTGSDNRSSVCEIFYAGWEETVAAQPGPGGGHSAESRSLTFTIRANRFLRNMVRAIVGTMVDIGRGKREPEYIVELLEKGTRSDAGQSVPGYALFLTDIRY